MSSPNGDTNAAVDELWKAKAWPSFGDDDGERRLRDLAKQMKPVIVDGQERSMIYPGKDAKVIRVIHKIVRVLSSFHGLESAVSEARVWADVLKYRLPEDLAQDLKFEHREEDICRYKYGVVADPGIDSLWILTFFEKRTFIAVAKAPTVGGQARGPEHS
jgi:hypothetical protein